jgi:uncharacterized protein YxjI
MEYPLSMSFKILAVAPQIKVTDATGGTVCYVQQKLFKLKEAVTVFSDQTKSQRLCEIKADRIIDFSASYHFFEADGDCFGGVRRKGMRSIWRAHYEVVDEANRVVGTIQEENPMAKVFDSLLAEVPVVGLLTGYFFNPRYVLKDASGNVALRLQKQRAFLESKFVLSKQSELDPVHELRCLMSFLMMALLERGRG